MLTPEHLTQGLESAALHAVGSFNWWGQFASHGHEFTPVNTFAPLPDEGDIHTPQNVRYFSGDWRLGPDEALVIDFDPSAGADYWGVVLITHSASRPRPRPRRRRRPGADYWGVVLITHWGETVDWPTRPTVINGETAVRREDGSVRVVVAHEDPAPPTGLTPPAIPRDHSACAGSAPTPPYPPPSPK